MIGRIHGACLEEPKGKTLYSYSSGGEAIGRGLGGGGRHKAALSSEGSGRRKRRKKNVMYRPRVGGNHSVGRRGGSWASNKLRASLLNEGVGNYAEWVFYQEKRPLYIGEILRGESCNSNREAKVKKKH